MPFLTLSKDRRHTFAHPASSLLSLAFSLFDARSFSVVGTSRYHTFLLPRLAVPCHPFAAMTKLQKASPQTSPGKWRSSATLQTAVPYESLPQPTQQPVAVVSAVAPSSFNDLPSTNPFSPNFTPQPFPDAAQTPPFSPVSPLVTSNSIERQPRPQSLVPGPQRPDSITRKPVDLRRLDGKPYPGSSPAERSQKTVRVAKDMHDGALPPVYKRQASDPMLSNQFGPPLQETLACKECGKTRGQGQGNGGHAPGCSQGGKRKASATDATATSAAAATSHARTTSEGMVSHQSGASESTAGPSNSPSSSTGARCCNKCGRHKRPGSVPMQQMPFDHGRPNGNGPATAPILMSSHPAMRVHQAGLSIQPRTTGSRAAYPQIDVIPPSASTYRPVNSPFTNYGDESPLVGKATKKEVSLFRNSSLVRSLSRRLSRKDKSQAAPAPLPSQQLAADENRSGEQSAGRLISMISSAMEGSPNDRDTQYLRLGGELDQPDRPQSPFSFVGGKDEEDAFELVDLRDRASTSDHDSLQVVMEKEEPITGPEAEYSAGQQDTIDVVPRPKSAEPRSKLLAVPDAESRPAITRFKSLRSGVSRMNSTVSNISRSSSLKRLGSLKTVHHNWYRNDMSIEGAMGDNVVPAF